MTDRSCHACATAVAPGATFCPRCGAALAASPAVAPIGVGAATSPAPWQAAVAAPGLRVVSWFVESLATLAVSIAATFLVGVLAAGMSGAGGLAFLLLLVWVPQLVAVAWGVFTWVWEGRTGKRIGNLVTGLRTVAVTTGQPPGMGKVFVSRLVIGLLTTAVFLVGSLLTADAGADSPVRTVVTVVVLLISALIAGTGALDHGPLRQGWHEKASGTTMIRAAGAPAVPVNARPAAVAPTALPARPAPVEVAAPIEHLAGIEHLAPNEYPAPSARPAQPTPAVAAPAPAVAAPATAPVAAPALPSAASDGLIAQVPGFSRVDPLPSPAPAEDDEDEIEHTRITRRSAAPARPRLSFDTGEVVLVEGLGLVGRAPEASAGESPAHLVPITDPDLSISKTHLAFGRDGDVIWVEDKGSTNGTDVVIPGGSTIPVLAGERVPVPQGATVTFGERSFTVGSA